MDLDRNKKLLIGGIGAGVALLGLFGYLIYSDWNAIERAQQDKVGLQQQVQRARAEIAQIPALEEGILVLRERVKKSAAVLPDDAEVHAFVDQMTAFATESGVVVTKLDDKDAKRRTGKSKSKDAFDRVVYKLSLEGNFEQFVRFIDAFENKYTRFVRIVNMNVRADSQRADDGTPRPHQIDLELETYVYNAKGKGQMVTIPSEDQKLERMRVSGKLDHVVEELDTYQLASARIRRDPFVDPRQARPDPVEGEAIAEQQKVIFTDFQRRLREAQEAIKGELSIKHLVELIVAQERNNRVLLSLRADIHDALTEEVFTVKELENRFRAEVADPFALLTRDRDLDGGGALSLDQLEGELRRMQHAVDAERYDEAISIYASFRDIRPADGATGPLADFFARMEPLHRRARVQLEAQRLQLAIQGVIASGNLPGQGVVIINRRSYGPGDLIQDGLQLVSVSESTVVFDYQGIEVVRHVSEGAALSRPKK